MGHDQPAAGESDRFQGVVAVAAARRSDAGTHRGGESGQRLEALAAPDLAELGGRFHDHDGGRIMIDDVTDEVGSALGFSDLGARNEGDALRSAVGGQGFHDRP